MTFDAEAKKKEKRIDITDLLVKPDATEVVKAQKKIVDKAKEEGRFLVLSPDNFYPDEDQARRVFDEEKLASLQVSIENNGQIQAITVRPKTEKGYQIIAGERRWRVISRSKVVNTIEAVIVDSDLEELKTIVVQLDENGEHERLNTAEKALSYKKANALCSSQVELSKTLNVDEAKLSKYLALAKAPQYILSLSFNDKVQDLVALYSLTTLHNSDKDKAKVVVDEWLKSDCKTSLRSKIKDALTETKKKKGKTDQKAAVKTVIGGSLDREGDSFVLSLTVGKNHIKYNVSVDVMDNIISNYKSID